MKKLDRRTLEIELALRLRNAMQAHAFGLKSKNTIEKEKAEAAVVAEVLDLIDCENTCVVRTDHVGFHMSERYGRFGVEEPWPCQSETVWVPKMTLGPREG